MVQPKLRFKREEGNEYPSLFECSIKDVSSIKNGPFGSVLHSSDYVLEGTPIITTEHFKSGIIQSDVSTIPKVSEEDYKRLKGYVLETGDIVFSRVGSIDINALVTERENGWLFSGRVIRVRLNGSYHSGYFHYLLSTQRVKNDIVARAVGQTMPSINSEILNSTSLMITSSYEEQQKIADFLSTVDEVIVQSEAEVQNLAQQKKAAMQKIFSQEVRFRREDGTSYPNWDEYLLQDISFYVTATAVGNKASFVGTENMKKGCMGVLFDTDGNSEVQGVKYQVNDILVSNIRPYLQKAWKADRNGICSIDVLCIRGNNGIDSNFLYDLIANDNFFDYVMQGAKGTKMPRGDKRHIMNMPVALPCLEEQQKIADFLSTNDEAISYAKQELDKWKEIKKGLLQEMFA